MRKESLLPAGPPQGQIRRPLWGVACGKPLQFGRSGWNNHHRLKVVIRSKTVSFLNFLHSLKFSQFSRYTSSCYFPAIRNQEFFHWSTPAYVVLTGGMVMSDTDSWTVVGHTQARV